MPCKISSCAFDAVKFFEEASKALSYSAKESARKKKEAIDVISANRSIFDSDSWEVKSCKEAAEKMIQAVEASIDPIEIHKDGAAMLPHNAYH